MPEGIELERYCEIIFTEISESEPTQNAEGESEEPGNTSPNTGDYAVMHTFSCIFSLQHNNFIKD